jgi:hypothetical protein
MSKSIAIATICALAALVSTDQTALAQAGSTGGTLGKTDKSASGGEESSPSGGRRVSPAASRHPQRNAEGNGKQRTYQNPTVDGLRVDYCLGTQSMGCGNPAAGAWCRRNGFSHAIKYKTEKSPTAYRLGDATAACTGASRCNDACPGILGGCDVLKVVICN